MTIVLDTSATPADEVVDGRGWRRTTPAGKASRYYEDTAPTCELGDATQERFESLTSVLGKCFPGDFAGPTLHWTTEGVIEHMDELAELWREWKAGEA